MVSRFERLKISKKRLVNAPSQIVLPDGQTITAGPTYETTMSSDLIQLISVGVLQASAFGKLKGGSYGK